MRTLVIIVLGVVLLACHDSQDAGSRLPSVSLDAGALDGGSKVVSVSVATRPNFCEPGGCGAYTADSGVQHVCADGRCLPEPLVCSATCVAANALFCVTNLPVVCPECRNETGCFPLDCDPVGVDAGHPCVFPDGSQVAPPENL